MKFTSKLKMNSIKIFIVPIIMITLIFLIVCNLTMKEINNYFYTNMKEASLDFAKHYSHNLSKGAEAYDVVNELLEEKVLVAGKTTALNDGEPSDELYTKLADILEVDEIDYYNSKGRLLFSNIEELIGWEAYKGHPVYDFMLADKVSYIGEIRKDSVTGNYYKYGYFKNPDSSFVQIGVRADKIHNFLGGFEMQHLLDEMKGLDKDVQFSFIDNDYIIIGSSNKQLIGQKITNRDVKEAILQSSEYGYMENSYYEVFVPVFIGEIKIGTISVQQSFSSTESLVTQASIIGLMILFIIYVALIYATLSSYRKNRKLIRLAFYDILTALPNNYYLNNQLAEVIKKKDKKKKAIFLIHYSNFKNITLTLGYETGDEVIDESCKRFKTIIDENKMLFRFASDKFILYAKNYDEQKELVKIANEISYIFNEPFKVKGAKQNIDIQMGIVEINNKYDDVDHLLKDVTISLSYIKHNDNVNYAFFNKEMELRLRREEMIEREIRNALDETNTENLYLVYQPLIDSKINQIIAFEALARMKIESLGNISPIEFIEVAEKKQLIVPLGNLILKKACDFIHSLNDKGFTDIKVAVNISGIQLLQDGFEDRVLTIIKSCNIRETSLELEITESIFLNNYEVINRRLKNLRDHNITIALDDFGTGYSSFSRLRELNIDKVKIDRYFINNISIKEQKELITGDIISMVHRLGLKVTAEGVEDELQKNYLVEHKCDILQGYLLGKPLPMDSAVQLLIE